MPKVFCIYVCEWGQNSSFLHSDYTCFRRTNTCTTIPGKFSTEVSTVITAAWQPNPESMVTADPLLGPGEYILYSYLSLNIKGQRGVLHRRENHMLFFFFHFSFVSWEKNLVKFLCVCVFLESIQVRTVIEKCLLSNSSNTIYT